MILILSLEVNNVNELTAMSSKIAGVFLPWLRENNHTRECLESFQGQ